MPDAIFRTSWNNWVEGERGGASHFVVKLTPYEQEVVIERRRLMELQDQASQVTMIFDAMRPYAVAAYNSYIATAVLGLGLSLRGIEAPDFVNVLVEQQAREIDRQRDRISELAGELLETKGRLEELRRLVSAHVEIVSKEDPDEAVRAIDAEEIAGNISPIAAAERRIALAHSRHKDMSFHDYLMTHDEKYRTAIIVLRVRGSDVFAANAGGRAAVLAAAADPNSVPRTTPGERDDDGSRDRTAAATAAAD